MLGAIIGDMVGSIYEFNNIKTTEFPLWNKRCRPTDDSIMSMAVADALVSTYGQDEDTIRKALISKMQEYGRKYPRAGYGRSFFAWINADDPQPYNSWGNGSAMRVSSVGWLFDNVADVMNMAALTASVSHDHDEGIKGAVAIALAVFAARTKIEKRYIKAFIEKICEYDLDFTLDEIRLSYEFDVSCQGSVPQAIVAFLEGNTYEEVVRLAVSIGGDSDTIAAMAGSIAEAYYGIPAEIKKEGLKILDDFQKASVKRYRDFYHKNVRKVDESCQNQIMVWIKSPYTTGCPSVENAISTWTNDGTDENYTNIFGALIKEIEDDLEVLVPVDFPNGLPPFEKPGVIEEQVEMVFNSVGDEDESWLVCFTSQKEVDKAPESSIIPMLFKDFMEVVLNNEGTLGVVINPFGESFSIENEYVGKLYDLVTPPQDVLDLNAGADAYQNGDFALAVELYRKSADAGNVTALSNLGYCYYYGRSVDVDKEEARTCWEKAAALGDICAVYKLGDMYRNGDLKEDLVYSKALYMKAFGLAVNDMDIYSFPDAFLRVLRHCRDEFDEDTLKKIAEDCVKGLEMRIAEGDHFSDKLLVEARSFL